MIEGLSLEHYLQIFAFVFLPIILFAIFLYGFIILSNRIGGKNKLFVFFIRFLLIGGLLGGFYYYFYYFVNFLL
jgi:hypothetical protein